VRLQVIVMSSHETIRVLEVGVDGDPKTAGEGAGGSPGQGGPPGVEDAPSSTPSSSGGEAAGKAKAASPTPGPSSHAPSQPGVTHLAVQAAPQVTAPEAGGARGDPRGCPQRGGGQVTGQQALALVTIPTATLAALPGLTPAAPAGAIFKPPVANLTGNRRHNPSFSFPDGIPVSVSQTGSQFQFPRTTSLPQVPHPNKLQLCFGQLPGDGFMDLGTPRGSGGHGEGVAIRGSPSGPRFPSSDPISVPQLTAALGAQPQLLGSLSAPPVITNPLPSIQGIPGQLLTNAQGQVIGTLPWVVAPPGVAAAAPAPAPASLQVTPVTPQLLLNAQGQVIATLATGATLATAPPAPAPSKKNGPTEPPVKSEVQPIQPAPAGVGTSPAPVAKVSPSPVPITCSETPTVSQLVSKPPAPPSAEEDGINLEEIREFAKNFKLRRLSLGLTQTQVGQALTATEGPAYSQSAICRFEKLDITPKSAQKLKPVLEKWLREAEQRQREGQQHLLEFVGGEPGKKRKRRTSFTPQALEALNAHFERNALPTGAEITRIAQELRYEREVVRVWFCNRRQTLKNTSKLNVFHVP
ncbi:PO6F1 factor, partial [Orthonyx spaldingii]|nr:PO6F1 factor [Orthonyx spaldingii]